MKWSHQSLKLLGLSRTEQRILEAVTIPRNVQGIAQTTRISRTGVNYCLEHLLQKGLVVKTTVGKRKKYVSLNPDELAELFQTIADKVSLSGKSRKKGARIKTSPENEFTIHVGAKEIIPAYERIAFENKNERIRAIQHHRSYHELLEKITPQQLIKFNRAIVKNHLIIDGMLNESAYQAYREEIVKNPKKYKASVESLKGRMADYTFFPDARFDHDAEIWIFRSTTLIINWHEEVAIEITNNNMTAFLKDMFEFVKRGGSKVDHHQALANSLKE